MYFEKLGTTEYNNITIPDIFKRIVISNPEITKSDLVEQYEITEGETPESLSFKYYDSVEYYWTIMLLNNIKSRYFDWPFSSQELGQYILGKYGNKSALFFHENNLTSNNIVLCTAKYIRVNTVENNYKEYQVYSCDRNLNKLEIEKITELEMRPIHTDLNLLDNNKNIITTLVADRIVYENEQSVHHFKISDTPQREFLVRYINYSPVPEMVTNQEFESELNEQKRKIYLIKPNFISLFVNAFKAAAQSS